MSVLLGLVFAAMLPAQPTDAPAAAGPYPEAEILALFSRTCSNVADVEGTRDRARELGWEPFDATASTILGRSIAQRKGKRGPGAQRIVVDRSYPFRRTIAGRELFLLILDERYPGSERRLRSRICSIYDYSAPGPISAGAARAWAGRPADVHLDALGDIMAWEPGITGASTATSLAFADGPPGLLDPGLELSSRFEDWNEQYAPLP